MRGKERSQSRAGGPKKKLAKYNTAEAFRGFVGYQEPAYSKHLYFSSKRARYCSDAGV